eukprot:jgi/Chlat1/537/Chrsp103S01115
MSVTMNVMLAIHAKRADPVDFAGPLRSYIARIFGEMEARDAQDDISGIQRMRDEVVAASDTLEHRIDLLQRYFRALSVIETRFPISKEKEHINVSFSWADAFKPTKKTAIQNIHYEKAAVLFNLGATYSQQGLAADRSTSEGLKSAYSIFQQAAGAWAHLRESEGAKVPLGASFDLGSECASMLERLMLAQAQECVYEKALADRKTSSTVCSKLAWQVGVFYEEAHAMLVLPPLNANFDKPWLAHLQLKAAQFRAEALYRSSLALRETESIAEEIARLKAAVAILNSSKHAGAPLVDAVQKLEGTISRNLERANKENDQIYLVRVPLNENLAPVGASCLVKPAPLAQALDGKNEKLFTRIVPDQSAKALSKYTEMVDEIIRNDSEALQRESDEARLRLREWDLPDMLLALDERGSGLPEPLQKEVSVVESRGGVNALHDLSQQLRELRQVNEELLAEVFQSLDTEGHDDENCRNQFKDRWRRPPSDTLTKHLRDKANSFKTSLQQAADSDERINRRWKDCELDLTLLTDPELPRLARPMVAVRGDEDAIAASLRQLLMELERVAAERAGLEEMLKDMKQKDNILPQLMSTTESYDNLFRRELGKYEQARANVAQNIRTQQDLLRQIDGQQRAFRQAYQVDDWKVACDRFEKRLRNAVRTYSELNGNMVEGVRFYSSLQDAINALKQQCGDFIMTRRIQREDMLEDLQRQVTKLTVSPIAPVVQPSVAHPAPAVTPSGPSGSSGNYKPLPEVPSVAYQQAYQTQPSYSSQQQPSYQTAPPATPPTSYHQPQYQPQQQPAYHPPPTPPQTPYQQQPQQQGYHQPSYQHQPQQASHTYQQAPYQQPSYQAPQQQAYGAPSSHYQQQPQAPYSAPPPAQQYQQQPSSAHAGNGPYQQPVPQYLAQQQSYNYGYAPPSPHPPQQPQWGQQQPTYAAPPQQPPPPANTWYHR